jgi:Response regulators consisting of a CheY-like receiver domain and a winged-helix DNA-binding domain
MILLAEPEASLRETWGAGLAAMGFQVREAETAATALQIALRFEIALVITELYLATRTERCLVLAARREPALRRVKILVVSARADEEDRQWALAAGADAYLIKPVRPGRLFQVAARLATSRRQPPQRIA